MANQQNQQKHIDVLFLTSTTFNANNPTPNFLAVQNTINTSLKDAITNHRNGITFNLKHENVLRPQDLFATINSSNPSVLILFTHATDEGVYLNDGTHDSVLVENSSIKTVIQQCVTEGNLKCVLLYACWSETLATELSSIVDCVIGMARPITDYNVNDFSASFFSAIGSGRSCSSAFTLATAVLNDRNAAKVPVAKFKSEIGREAVYPYIATLLQPAIPDRIGNTKMKLIDLSDYHKYQLQRFLDQESAFGVKGAIELATRIQWTHPDTIEALLGAEHPTKALIHQLTLYGTGEQQPLSYLYKKLMEYPPFTSAASALERAVII